MSTAFETPTATRSPSGASSKSQQRGQAGSEGGSMAHLRGEYLTFRLGNEEYGIDILKVQEIRGYEQPTRIANAPEFIKGVVNLRGTIVPIVYMRLRFNCSEV